MMISRHWSLAAGLAGIFFCTQTSLAVPVDSVRVASGLSNPIFVTHAPGDLDRVFIVEQCGLVKVLTGGSILPAPFLNITSRLTCGGEQGLLGLAFHPDYAANGTFFVNYTNTSGTTVIARYMVTGNPNVADSANETQLLTIAQPFVNHNGGWMAFGAEGYLYIATGDGGSGNDPGNRAQDITAQLLGKMLRIDVNADDFPADPAKNYAIPPTNPFVGLTGDDEIWAYGLRNPWRNSFDRLTHDLYVGDVGQNAVEEVDFQRASSVGGENYGWRCMEGNNCTGLTGCTCNAPTLVLPIHTYTHGASNCSITGGYVYRGCEIAGLEGTYFFADYCSNKIWSFRWNGASITEFADRTSELTPNIGSISNVSSFGEDAYGELYICDHTGGEVFKIIATSASPDCNNNLRTDRCDIAVGFSQDANGDGFPDECFVAPPPPTVDPTGIAKSRAVSFAAPAATMAAGGGSPTALRVTLTSLHHPVPPYTGGDAADFSAFEGQVRWVGPPSVYVESTSAPTPFTASALQCAPYYHDWSSIGLLHVIGREIVPSSLYSVAQLSIACQGNEVGCTLVSDAIGVSTTRWGDVEAPFNPPSSTTQPDVVDVSGLVNKFRSAVGAPIKVRAAIAGNVPDLVPDIDFTHISACVDAFKGSPYPYAGPATCP